MALGKAHPFAGNRADSTDPDRNVSRIVTHTIES